MNTKFFIMALSLCTLTAWSQTNRPTQRPPQRPPVAPAEVRAPARPAAATTQINQQQALIGQDRGGGDAIVCGQGEEQKVFLADYFLSKDVNAHYEAIINHHFANDLNGLQRAVFNFIQEQDPEEYDRIVWIHLNYTYTHRNLIELDDDNIRLDFMRRLFGCRKQQLAIQNISNRSVVVTNSLYVRMTSLQKAMLDIHERYINLMKEPGEDTSEIRRQTMAHITSPEFGPFILRSISRGDTQKLIDLQFAVEVLRKETFFSGTSNPDWSATHGIKDIYEEMGLPAFDFMKTMRAYRSNACQRLITTAWAGRVIYDQNFEVWTNCVKDSIRY